MVTVLDVGLLKSFDVIFAAILVFALVFALLRKTKAFGASLSVDAIIAVAASFLVLISEKVVSIINFMIPWFVVAFIFIMLLLLIFQIFGMKEKDISNYLRNDKGLGWLLFAVGLVIFVAAVANTLGQETLEATQGPQNLTAAEVTGDTATGNFQSNIMQIIFNPKVLGLVVLLGIMIFAIALLTGSPD